MKTLTLFVFLFFLPGFINAQDSVRVIILSDKVGEEIDKQERTSYHLFERFRTFEKAVFFQDSDSFYFCKLTYSDKNRMKDTIIAYSYKLIRNIAMRIEYFNELTSGVTIDDALNRVKLTPGQIMVVKKQKPQSGIKSEYDTLKKSTPVQVRKVEEPESIRTKGLLPIRKSDYVDKDLIRNKFRIGASFGILINGCKYEGLSALYNEIEEKVPEPEYEIKKTDIHLKTPAMLKLGIDFLINEWLFAEINSAFTFRDDPKNVKYNSASVNLAYVFSLTKFMHTYIGAGYQAAVFSYKHDYYQKVASNGLQLEYIQMQGKANMFRWTIGTIISPRDMVNFHLYWSYNLGGKLKINKQYPSDTSVMLNGWEFGISMIIF